MSSTSIIARLQLFIANILANLAHQYDAIVYSGLPIFFWIKPRVDTTKIPDQSGKVIIVTGGNSGTGYITCQTFYHAGAKVYMASRSPSRAKEAMQHIKSGWVYDSLGFRPPGHGEGVENGSGGVGGGVGGVGGGGGMGSLEFLELDLSDLDSVGRFVEEFEKREERLDVVFANAGVMASPEGLYTKQGYTLQFGTNCLGHQRLISLLLPLLQKTSKCSSSPSRLITTSSAGHSAAPIHGIDYKSIIREPSTSNTTLTSTIKGEGEGEGNEDRPVKGRNERMKWVEYGQSKWGNIAIGRWAHWVYGPKEGRRKGHGRVESKTADGEVISISVHPGCVATNLAQHLWLTPYIAKYAPWMISLIAKSPQDGASNQIWAATCPDVEARKLSGEYIVPFQKVGHARPELDDHDKLEKLWNWCEDQGKKGL